MMQCASAWIQFKGTSSLASHRQSSLGIAQTMARSSNREHDAFYADSTSSSSDSDEHYFSDFETPASDDEKRADTLTSTCIYTPRVPARHYSDRDGFHELSDAHLIYQAERVATGVSTASDNAKFVATLYEIADYYDNVRGKWLVFAPPRIADELWEAITGANEVGHLGGYCELRVPMQDGASHLIAVFCNDLTVVDDVLATLHALCEICDAYNVPVAAFKPEFMSELGIYATRRPRCRYTFTELGIASLWQREDIRTALKPTTNGAARKRRAREHRRQRRVANTPARFERTNNYANDKVYTPTRPNARWTKEELDQGWLYSHSDAASLITERRVRDPAKFLKSAREILDAHQKRMQTSRVDRAGRQAVMRQLYALAASHDYLVGKWKVFAPPGVADDLWASIHDANMKGRLGGCCKLGTFNARSGCFLICVYVNSFLNIKECNRVLIELNSICAPFNVPVVANFKCDFLTKLGVYRSRSLAADVDYALSELGLVREWPNEKLKALLDGLKKEVREKERAVGDAGGYSS